MSFVYPLDAADLVSRAKKRGADFVEYIGLEDGMRDDLVLTTLAWTLSAEWFPVNISRQWHGRIDLGLPDGGGDTLYGAEVKAVGDGEVVFVDESVYSDRDFDQGRVILRHQSPSGEDFFVQYLHLERIDVLPFQRVKAGDVIGTVGWHGDFPHLSFGACSLERIGGDDDLIPEFSRDALPGGEGVWNALRVSLKALDPIEWPLEALQDQAAYVFNPVELVRFCRGEPYEHDIGTGSRHTVKPAAPGDGKNLPPDADVEIVVPTLQSAALKGNAALVELSHDRGFAPLEKNHSDQDAVKALQKALKVCHFDLGRFGPDHDGVDGDYGKATQRVLAQFQNVQLRQILKEAGDKGILGLKESDLRTDGKLDWLTLIGLDMAAKAHESAPPPPKPAPTKAEPPPRPAAPPPPPPSGGDWVFDGQKKTLSLRLGMKMYQALLGWESDGKSGVGYSTCNKKHYGTVIPAGLSPEWPDMGIASDSTKDVGGKSYPVYSCFRVNWVGSNFTNCCNSQMAALVMALGGGTFGVKGADGTVVTYDIRRPKDKKKEVLVKVRAKKGAKEISRATLAVFEQTFVSGMLFYDLDDKPLYGGSYGGMIWAIQFMRIGEPVFKFTTKQEELRKMRVGDLATYDGHAWLVGDVRYGVWFKGTSGAVDCILDQSSFIDGAAGKMVKVPKKGKTRNLEGRAPMKSADCDWVIAHEAEFEKRVTDFLAATKLKDADGVDQEVEKIEVAHWRVFSANGNKKTAHSKQYDPDGDNFKLNEKATADLAKINGITRPWCSSLKNVAVGRLYGQV